MDPHNRPHWCPPAGTPPAARTEPARAAPTQHDPALRDERTRARKGGMRLMAHPPPAYDRNLVRQIAHGTWQPWADPAPVRDHVHRLLQTATFQAVADAASVGQMTVWEIAPAPRPAIKTGTARALLPAQPHAIRAQRVDPNRSMLRVRYGVAIGPPP